MRILKKIEEIILKIEYFFVIVLLLTLCFLAFTQVVLRNAFSYSFVWADIVVRMLVLWVAIFGASIATSERGHVHIDLLTRMLPPPYNRYLDAFLSLVAASLCFLFLQASLKFVSVEKGVGSVNHLLWGAPEWIFATIFPIGFTLIMFKFLLCFLTDILGDERRLLVAFRKMLSFRPGMGDKEGEGA